MKMKMIPSDTRKPEVNKGAMLFLTISLILATHATAESTETTATTTTMTTPTTTTNTSSPAAVIESASEATSATTPIAAEVTTATTTTMTTTTMADPSSPAAVIESASEATPATTPMAAEATPATTTTSSLEEAENETTWPEETTATEILAEEESATLTTLVATSDEIAATTPKTTPAETTPSTTTSSTTTPSTTTSSTTTSSTTTPSTTTPSTTTSSTTTSTTTTITAATTAAEISVSAPLPTTWCISNRHEDCNQTIRDTYCYGNGLCCQLEHQELICQCNSGFEPPRCDVQSVVVVLESHDQALLLTTITSHLSMVIAILALVALIIVTVILVKRAQSKQQKVIDRAEDLDREILYVQGELAKLSPAEKMTRLTRLSRIVEATARATVLICPASQTAGQASGTTNGQVLPRRSSAPCALDRPAGQFSNGSRKEGSSNIEKRSGKPSFIKKTRHQIFSV